MPQIMSITEFQTQTRHTSGDRFKSRGRLYQVDRALEAWHAAALGFDDEMKLAAAYALQKECKKWIKIKQSEKSKQSTQARMKVVLTLLQQSTECLDELVNAFGLSRAQNRFEERKFTRGSNDFSRPLQGVYRHERTLYLEHGKKRAPSGTLFDGQLKHEKVKWKGPHFQDLSLNQYKKLDKLTQSKLNVLYLNKIQRLKYMAFPVNGLLCDSEDNPITTKIKRGEPYAMDRYGNLFVDDRGVLQMQHQVNHSTFNSGREVICAGSISIREGLLKMIDNCSGHYKPTKEHLREAIIVLAEEGVNLTEAVATYLVPPAPGRTDWLTRTLPALEFLDNPDSLNYVQK